MGRRREKGPHAGLVPGKGAPAVGRVSATNVGRPAVIRVLYALSAAHKHGSPRR